MAAPSPLQLTAIISTFIRLIQLAKKPIILMPLKVRKIWPA